jgi:hypothetical protein
MVGNLRCSESRPYRMAGSLWSARHIFGRPVIRHCLLLGVVFVIAQWVQPDVPLPVLHYERASMWENPDLDRRVAAILKKSCIDCHSNETRWPWYARISPGSWLMTNQVRRGRQQFNFSEQWAFTETQRSDIAESVNDGSMPPRAYLLLHPSARLNQADREIITDWAEGRFDARFKSAN